MPEDIELITLRIQAQAIADNCLLAYYLPDDRYYLENVAEAIADVEKTFANVRAILEEKGIK